MISIWEARRMALEEVRPLGEVEVPLDEAVGHVLAEDVASDVDLPPFDRSAMDGYAVRAEDVGELPAVLEVLEDVPAGSFPRMPLSPGKCTRVMTGAPVPEGTDLVVIEEHTEPLPDGRVRILKAGKENVCLRGEEVRKGEVVLRRGHPLRPPEVGLLAAVGAERIKVFRKPKVAVVATGDELVDLGKFPGPGQIRDVNTHSLLALCRSCGFEAESFGISRDEPGELRKRIKLGMDGADVVLVSAGVSVGKYDLVPEVLEGLGVRIVFHNVAMKPGKPTLFGVHSRGVLFGLPGNPVSTVVAFLLFVEPALRKMAGFEVGELLPLKAVLDGKLSNRGDRTALRPCRLLRDGEGWRAAPVQSHGSADIASLSRADGFVVVGEGESLGPGDVVDVISLEAGCSRLREAGG